MDISAEETTPTKPDVQRQRQMCKGTALLEGAREAVENSWLTEFLGIPLRGE